MKHRHIIVVLTAALLLGSCAFPVESEHAIAPVETAEIALYARDVHPLLEASCATLDCHGSDRHALQLFAETGRRASATYRTTPAMLVQPDELEANVRALRVVDEGEPDIERGMVLRKPLALSEGGVAHVGRALWANRDDPAYVCLRAFLLREGETPAAHDACVAAYEKVKLPDRPAPPL